MGVEDREELGFGLVVGVWGGDKGGPRPSAREGGRGTIETVWFCDHVQILTCTSRSQHGRAQEQARPAGTLDKTTQQIVIIQFSCMQEPALGIRFVGVPIRTIRGSS